MKFPAPSNSFGVELLFVVSVTPMQVISDFWDKEIDLHFPARAQEIQHGRCTALSDIKPVRDIITKEVEDEIRHR